MHPDDPRGYPWDPPDGPTLLVEGGLEPLSPQPGRGLGSARVGAWTLDEELDAIGVPSTASRFLVVAVGSNASPRVLRRKLGADGLAVPLVRGRVGGLGIGHSGHVSAGGYVAATPFANPLTASVVWASLLDRDQLAVLDRSEPSYRRLLVRSPDHRLELDHGEVPATYYLYESRHGRLVLDGASSLLTQQLLLRRLRSHVEVGTSLTGAGFADPDVRESLRQALVDASLTRACGVVGQESDELVPYAAP